MRRASPFLTLALVACASASTPSPAPAPTRTPTSTPTAVPPFRGTEPPANWHLLDMTLDGLPGVSSERAMRELVATMAPRRTVVVAVIDGGTDTAHTDLRANLWTNPRERAGNGRDDDGNGYVDDVHGWNFIGGKDGRNVGPDTYELTRVAKRCQAGTAPYPADRCATIRMQFDSARADAAGTFAQVKMVDSVFRAASATLRPAVAPDSVSPTRVQALQSADMNVQRARSVYLNLVQQGLTRDELDGALKAYGSRATYGFNPDFDPRNIVGDNYGNLTERVYGNADVTGPDALHGTHVAGIIGAVRGNGTGTDGIAPAVQLMILRAVPDGDERDKDVANAIRYAADNGAHIINMSFGKALSPEKQAVDAAAQYAASKGVLLVHAAGNDGSDNAKKPNYPNPLLTEGTRTETWIEVGASAWSSGSDLVAPFSNYSRPLVDLFAPGVDILAPVPGNKFERESGTSMAAPVVSGVAALLMAYYPRLTAVEVRRILLESATKRPDDLVKGPGDGRLVPFGSLSLTGGIVNAYAALRMAQTLEAGRR